MDFLILKGHVVFSLTVNFLHVTIDLKIIQKRQLFGYKQVYKGFDGKFVSLDIP